MAMGGCAWHGYIHSEVQSARYTTRAWTYLRLQISVSPVLQRHRWVSIQNQHGLPISSLDSIL